jgi:hypothetical protein
VVALGVPAVKKAERLLLVRIEGSATCREPDSELTQRTSSFTASAKFVPKIPQ